MDNNINNLPNASHKAEARDIKPVVDSNNVRFRNPGIAKRAMNNVNSEGVMSYLFRQILGPAMRDTAYDLVSKGASYLLYGDNKPTGSTLRSSRNNERGTYVSYNGYSQTSHNQRQATKQSYSYGPVLPDMIFDNRFQAQEVMDAIQENFSRYNNISVQDLYAMCGHTCPFTYQNWGYFDISNFRMQKCRDGWEIVLPRPEPLE